MSLLAGYPKIDRFIVPFADIDMLRHVNNVAYVRWVEHARTAYMAEVLREDILGSQGMIIAKLTIEYASPIMYREHVAIGTRIGRIGTKSFDFEHAIVSEDREIVAATISSTLVAFDYAANATIAVPTRWRELIANFQDATDTQT